MDVHPTKNVSIGIDPYPYNVPIMKLAIHLTYPQRPLPFPAVLGAIHTLAWLPGGTGGTGGT